MTNEFLVGKNLKYEWRNDDIFSKRAKKVLWTIDEISIRQPGIILLAGRNGVGKSTLLRCLLGLMRPTHGEVFWFGEQQIPRGKIGYIPELPVLPTRVKVREFLSSLLGKSAVEIEKLQNDFFKKETLQITSLLDRDVQLLSKGQQQRLLLTLALAGSPKGFVLDEPFSGLDPWARAELAELLVELCTRGHFLLISSHDAPARLRLEVKETWLIENEQLLVQPGCIIPE